jgi:guanylate kinase
MFSIISFTGPSGSGKTTIQKYVGAAPIITFTSRKPRKSEVDGVHYHFTTRENILEMKEKGELLEVTEYSGNLYASNLKTIHEVVKNQQTSSIVVDVHGARELKKHFNERVLLVGVFASKDECRQRIYSRSDSNIEKRLYSYDEDVKGMLEICNLVIINSDENWLKNKKILDFWRKSFIEIINTDLATCDKGE